MRGAFTQPSDSKPVGIIGEGVVGGALRAYLEDDGYDVRVYDPPKGYDSITHLDDAEIVFICVPTPYTHGIGFDDRGLADQRQIAEDSDLRRMMDRSHEDFFDRQHQRLRILTQRGGDEDTPPRSGEVLRLRVIVVCCRLRCSRHHGRAAARRCGK